MNDERERFMQRWSRLKRETAEGGDGQPPAQTAKETRKDDEPPPLPPLDTLGPDSDFSGFMHPKVDPALRRQALARLFSSPQYHGNDGLDVYVGDYSQPVPLAPAVAAGLRHARAWLARQDGTEAEQPPLPAEAAASGDSDPIHPPPESDAEPLPEPPEPHADTARNAAPNPARKT